MSDERLEPPPAAQPDSLDVSGCLRKMRVAVGPDGLVEYQLALQAPPSGPKVKGAPPESRPVTSVALNAWVGHQLSLEFLGAIHCVHCGRKTSKSYNQGYCYPCCKTLARCDQCIVRPQLCHYHEGTCREEIWGERNCMTEHIVYLANTSGCKAGITRANQVPTRWIDQGAVQALPIISVQTRQQSGFAEVLLHRWSAGTTQWRAMLGDVAPIDLCAERARLLELASDGLSALRQRFGLQFAQLLDAPSVQTFRYPVHAWPGKLKTLRLDREGAAHGQLLAIKGQYLVFERGALNLRSAAGHWVRCRAWRS